MQRALSRYRRVRRQSARLVIKRLQRCIHTLAIARVADDPSMHAHLSLALFDDLLYEALEYAKPAPIGETFAHGTRFLLRALRCSEARVRHLVPLDDR